MRIVILVSIFLAALVGLLLGLGLRSSLSRLHYRIIGPRDDEREFPYPGSRWWVPLVLSLAWFALATAFAHPGWPWLLLWLPFAATGTWLAAVDLDVLRLPDKVLVWVGLHALVAGGLLIYLGHASWLPAVVGAVATGALFGLVHAVSHGALGFGDVKYVTICGWCLGLMGWTPIFYGVIIACFCAIIWALTRRVQRFAFGPWLALGTVWTATLVGFGLSGALPFSLP